MDTGTALVVICCMTWGGILTLAVMIGKGVKYLNQQDEKDAERIMKEVREREIAQQKREAEFQERMDGKTKNS
jgi:hypothetical protein